MCYHNGQKISKSEKIRLCHLEKLVADYDFLNREYIDGFDYGYHAILKPQEGQEDFDIIQSEWGFIPSWIKTEEELTRLRLGGINPITSIYEKPITTLNAIGEELLDKPMYKDAARYRHCIILSSGFIEWRHIYPYNKRTGRPLKTSVPFPYFISLPDKVYFYMAGIWNPWQGRISSAIPTTAANELMGHVHNKKKRMPTILTEELAFEWMFGKLDDRRIIEIATTQCNADEMYAYPLARDFRTNGDPLKRVEHSDLPPIPLPKYLKEYEHIIIDDGDLRQGSLFG